MALGSTTWTESRSSRARLNDNGNVQDNVYDVALSDAGIVLAQRLEQSSRAWRSSSPGVGSGNRASYPIDIGVADLRKPCGPSPISDSGIQRTCHYARVLVNPDPNPGRAGDAKRSGSSDA